MDYEDTVPLISTRGVSDILGKNVVKDNICSAEGCMRVSASQRIYAISIHKDKLSHSMISRSGSFAVNFLPVSYKDVSVYCSRMSGHTIDKFREAGFTKREAEKINCSVIKESEKVIECEVVNQIDAGDHTIFIGKILTEY